MIASHPWSSSQRASSTEVAEEVIFAPALRTRATKFLSGRPKWKLTTSGWNSMTRSHILSSKEARLEVENRSIIIDPQLDLVGIQTSPPTHFASRVVARVLL